MLARDDTAGGANAALPIARKSSPVSATNSDGIKMRAAGVLLVDPQGRALFLRRSSQGDHDGEWGVPGGKVESDEIPVQAALRELAEETGIRLNLGNSSPEVVDHAVSPEGVDYTTYLQRVSRPVEPKLCQEHTGHAWAPLYTPPEPTHPGLSKTIKGLLKRRMERSLRENPHFSSEDLQAGDENESTATPALLRRTIKFPPDQSPGGERTVDVSFRRGGSKSRRLPMAPEARELNSTTADDAAGTKVTLCVIRHGATKLNNDVDESEDRIRGWRDVPLVEKGREEARRAARKISKEHVAAVYCSDLSRAVETAEIIGEELGLEPIPTRKLRPWDLGDYTGMTTKEALPKLAEFVRSKPDEAVPKGESFDSFLERSFDGYHECAAKHPGKIVVLVTHHRNERTLEAWSSAGQPPDHQIDLDVFLQKGDPPGGVKKIETTLEALAGKQVAKDEKKDDEDEPEVERKEDGGDLKVKVKVKIPLDKVEGSDAEFEESKHPRDPSGKFGAGGGGENSHVEALHAAGQSHEKHDAAMEEIRKLPKSQIQEIVEKYALAPRGLYKTREKMLQAISQAWVRRARFENKIKPSGSDAEFEESKHQRDEGGKFTSGASGATREPSHPDWLDSEEGTELAGHVDELTSSLTDSIDGINVLKGELEDVSSEAESHAEHEDDFYEDEGPGPDSPEYRKWEKQHIANIEGVADKAMELRRSLTAHLDSVIAALAQLDQRILDHAKSNGVRGSVEK